MIRNGIYSGNDFIVKINNKTAALSGKELIKNLKLKIDKNNIVHNLYFVGLTNSFVEIDSINFTKLNSSDQFLQIVVDSYRKVIVTKNYPCAIVDKDMKILGVTSAYSLKQNKTHVPISKMLQIFSPQSYRKGVGTSILNLLDAEKNSKDLKSYFVASRIKSVKEVDLDDGYLISIKTKKNYRPFIQTSSGMLLHSC